MEDRSALLLGIANDNNPSCAIGPFIPLFGSSLCGHCSLVWVVRPDDGFGAASADCLQIGLVGRFARIGPGARGEAAADVELRQRAGGRTGACRGPADGGPGDARQPTRTAAWHAFR